MNITYRNWKVTTVNGGAYKGFLQVEYLDTKTKTGTLDIGFVHVAFVQGFAELIIKTDNIMIPNYIQKILLGKLKKEALKDRQTQENWRYANKISKRKRINSVPIFPRLDSQIIMISALTNKSYYWDTDTISKLWNAEGAIK